MIIKYGFFFMLSAFISFLATPVISRIALKNGVLDYPGGRKIHPAPKPLMGGLSIYLAVIVTSICFLPLTNRFLSVLIGGSILVVLGVLDDIYNLKPYVKLPGQALAASVLVFMNLDSLEGFFESIARFYIPDFLTVLIVIFWVVVIINALNLIDGVDGLAAGTAVIIFFGLGAVAYLNGSLNLLGVALIGAGSCSGFLVYNVYPARIFLGDAGSMFLGFFLAALHLFTISEPFSLSALLGSVFLFAYPVLDVTYAVYRRLRLKGNIFCGDQGHIHHILLRMGLSVRRAVLLLWLIGLVTCGFAVFLFCLPMGPLVELILLIASVAAVVAVFFYLNSISKKMSARYKTPLRINMDENVRKTHHNWFK